VVVAAYQFQKILAVGPASRVDAMHVVILVPRNALLRVCELLRPVGVGYIDKHAIKIVVVAGEVQIPSPVELGYVLVARVRVHIRRQIAVWYRVHRVDDQRSRRRPVRLVVHARPPVTEVSLREVGLLSPLVRHMRAVCVAAVVSFEMGDPPVIPAVWQLWHVCVVADAVRARISPVDGYVKYGRAEVGVVVQLELEVSVEAGIADVVARHVPREVRRGVLIRVGEVRRRRERRLRGYCQVHVKVFSAVL